MTGTDARGHDRRGAFMVHVLRVSELPGRALIWVRMLGATRVVYITDEWLRATGDVGPWKTGI